jgi:hypothetical protein
MDKAALVKALLLFNDGEEFETLDSVEIIETIILAEEVWNVEIDDKAEDELFSWVADYDGKPTFSEVVDKLHELVSTRH